MGLLISSIQQFNTAPTPKQTPMPTIRPTLAPTPTQTPEPSVPRFEAALAIVELLTVACLVRGR